MITKTTPRPSLFSALADQLNPKHPLYLLAGKIDWRHFEEAFSPLYCATNGRPAKPIRLMCGLLILKHVRNLSDESVVEQWSENAYYQYFCGMSEFTPSYPCNASELVHFRKRIGKKGLELILSESIRVNQEGDNRDHHGTAFIDSTVQEKNVTYPTDAKLHKKIVWQVERITGETIKTLPCGQQAIQEQCIQLVCRVEGIGLACVGCVRNVIQGQFLYGSENSVGTTCAKCRVKRW